MKTSVKKRGTLIHVLKLKSKSQKDKKVKNTSLQIEKFETAIEISKLQFQLETDRMKRESTQYQTRDK